ncbi:MAG: methylenetetrahydrofolate reductase [Deltaproteobacteria bacterium]|nr:methylenetetrahydrofolate reductase [Deltaproteobacteria bacterium]MBW2047295.1 methylenetetrahydrofolate reductase [Deltaproteobacteria bacterium]MBW2110035.1 methylenetetrahydrofolate reductase [Deltaproteobacteria bacterium]MBW2353322.1 methylenetetrahydrofolate reductase [Deltaproteobacteria bacterium]HDZ90386.1 5,10-methylenetetrahydrofolate reductase [Deltaproteobacteria bacterium]
MTLKEKIASRKFVVLGEFEPPKGNDFSRLTENANQVKGRLDAVVVPEMANGVMKASSLGGCAYLKEKGLETVLQVCCRDRNRLALQADILSASALGISNLMAVPGEDIRFGDHPQAREVYDLDLMELLEAMGKMREGRDMAGIELMGSPAFFTGSTLNAGAIGGALDIEIKNLEKMLKRGVEFAITTPVFDLHRFRQFLKRVDMDRVAIIPTVLLLKSAGMARYIDRNIKNVSIPPEMIRGIQKAPDKMKQCIGIAAELINQFKDLKMAGVMISTVGWEDKLPQLLDTAKI